LLMVKIASVVIGINRCEQSEKAERNGEPNGAKARKSEARSARAQRSALPAHTISEWLNPRYERVRERSDWHEAPRPWRLFSRWATMR
jgi:hypothetical protein